MHINKPIILLIVTIVCLFLVISSRNSNNSQELSISYIIYPNSSEKDETSKEEQKLEIIIISVVTDANTSAYKRALAVDTDFKSKCKQRDKFFRRHCVAAQFLGKCDYLLFLDADMGVVNPSKKIEAYIDPRFDVTFYERFYNQEIMAGAYLLKNSAYALEFITGFADYGKKSRAPFSGTDNGALHLYYKHPEDYQTCLELYSRSRNYDDLFIYEACARALMGINEEIQNIKIFRKGDGWARDSWLTNSMWNPSRDFIFHGWKSRQLLKYNSTELPIKPTTHAKSNWYDPLVGEFDFDKCKPGNVSWNYDRNLIAPVEVLEETMEKIRRKVNRDKFFRLARIPRKLNLRKRNE